MRRWLIFLIFGPPRVGGVVFLILIIRASVVAFFLRSALLFFHMSEMGGFGRESLLMSS